MIRFDSLTVAGAAPELSILIPRTNAPASRFIPVDDNPWEHLKLLSYVLAGNICVRGCCVNGVYEM